MGQRKLIGKRSPARCRPRCRRDDTEDGVAPKEIESQKKTGADQEIGAG
jgi:hypothetical protein